jgi:tetratricopeptide (TPR) repeat protein
MDDPSRPSDALTLLARLYRERRSGLLLLGPAEAPLRVLLREGQVVGLGPVEPPTPATLPRPDDSARLKLERVLAEVGIRRRSAKPAPVDRPATDLRDRVLDALADASSPVAFEEAAEAPPDVAETAGPTEPLILEAVRRLHDGGAVRAALGDLDQRLAATAAFAEERTLTLTEGYLLSRIDGLSSARRVLQLAPLDPEEVERSLLGLLLTGRVEYRAAPRAVPWPEPEEPQAGPEPGPDAERAVESPEPEPLEPEPLEPAEAYPEASLVEPDELPADEGVEAPPPAAPLDPEALERRREILDIFQSLPLKNHFEVLGVEPGCSDADVKRAYVALAKRFHPDARRDPRFEDLHDVLGAIFIRVGEAWEVLGDARSRASYEARSGVVRRVREGVSEPAEVPAAPAASPPPPAPEYVPPEDTILQAQLLLLQARYWDAIQVLEAAVPQMQPQRQQNRARILLARAYAKNPNWVRKAKETLQEVVNDDPRSVEAHYELGLLYKAEGMAARAQAMFRRVVELRPDHREAAAELTTGESTGGLLKRLFGRGKAS